MKQVAIDFNLMDSSESPHSQFGGFAENIPTTEAAIEGDKSVISIPITEVKSGRKRKRKRTTKKRKATKTKKVQIGGRKRKKSSAKRKSCGKRRI